MSGFQQIYDQNLGSSLPSCCACLYNIFSMLCFASHCLRLCQALAIPVCSPCLVSWPSGEFALCGVWRVWLHCVVQVRLHRVSAWNARLICTALHNFHQCRGMWSEWVYILISWVQRKLERSRQHSSGFPHSRSSITALVQRILPSLDFTSVEWTCTILRHTW